jgi:hypothetical protein
MVAKASAKVLFHDCPMFRNSSGAIKSGDLVSSEVLFWSFPLAQAKALGTGPHDLRSPSKEPTNFDTVSDEELSPNNFILRSSERPGSEASKLKLFKSGGN